MVVYWRQFCASIELSRTIFFRPQIKKESNKSQCLVKNQIKPLFWSVIFSKTFRATEQCFDVYRFMFKNWIFLLYYYQIYINLWWWVCEPVTLVQWSTIIIHRNCILNINEESDLNNKRQWLINNATSEQWAHNVREKDPDWTRTKTR